MLPSVNIRASGMWYRINMFAGVLAAWFALLAMPTGAHAAQPLDEPVARQAYAVAAQWVSRGKASSDPPQVLVTDLAGVELTVRLEGLRLGQARLLTEAPTDRRAEVDLMPLLARAVNAALMDADATLRALRSRPEGIAFEGSLSDLAGQLALDIQFAHVPRPLQLDDLSELPRKIVPSGHGLALQRQQQTAWLFSGTAIAANLSLQEQLYRLLAEVGLPAAQIRNIGKQVGPKVHAFRVIHLSGRPGTDGPARVDRFARRPASSTPDLARVKRTTDQWAQRLVARQRQDGRFSGTYHPSSSDYDPTIAGTADAALAVFALARYARLGDLIDQQNAPAANAARLGVIALCEQLVPTGPRGRETVTGPQLHLAPAAMTLAALIETSGTGGLKDRRDRLAGALLSMQNPDGSFRHRTGPEASSASIGSQALAVHAMVSMYEQTRDANYANHARAGLMSLWQQAGGDKAVAAMPWLAMAELAMARLDEPTANLAKLRQVARVVRQVQVQPTDASQPPDTTGGIILDAMIIPEPTWQSARPLTMLALLPRDTRLSDPEQLNAHLMSITQGLGFLARLSLDQPNDWYVRQPGEARGAVRQAMWDNRQPLAATAMALLAGAEFQHTLDALLQRAEP